MKSIFSTDSDNIVIKEKLKTSHGTVINKEEIEETEFVYVENIIIMAEIRQINSADIKAEIKEEIIPFEDTVLEEKQTNVLHNKQGPYEDFMQFNEEKHIIEESENLTSNNMGEMKFENYEEIIIKEEKFYDEAETNDRNEFPNDTSNTEELLNKTSEHIVNPLVSTNVKDEDCVSDPELFEDNAADDEYLPSHSSSSAASEAADSDLDTVETPGSHKVIKSEGTNSNETAMLCNKTFPYNHTLSRDERIHNNIRPHKCSVCNKVFTQRSTLTIHERIHSGKKPYKCNVCNKTFAKKSDLTKHERIHTGEKPYKCSVCNKVFADRAYLITHERIHSGNKPYKCNVCNKAFAVSSHLVTHERIHTGIKPYKCNVCNKVFARRDNLTEHERIHNGKKPFKCNVCNKAFAHSSHLVTHERIHTGIKPYKCNVCNKAFARRDNLTEHERIHNGKKPYKCNVCNKAFKQHTTLKTHERIHNNDRRYKCSVCNKEFTQKVNLTTHMRMHKIQAKA